MKIVVLVKQVPEIALVNVDESSGKVEYPQGPGVINPFDSYAIEEALKIKEKDGAETVAISVGGKQSEVALKEALSLGIDKAVLVSDPLFENSDNQAVAKILAAALKKMGEFDLVLGGKQAIDSDDAMVPAALAAHLGTAQAMFVRKITEISDSSITLERTTEDGHDVVEVGLPAVLSVVKEINEPRLPSLKGKMKAKKATIEQFSAADLGLDGEGVGEKSPSKTEKASNPPPRPAGEMIEGETPEEIADKLFKKLREDQVI
ncbi:MAG: electron transfer flavoprotein subunit beta [candidate division Zixibacteria bacterium]|nr:electron transfer flavoprotein subunit beta [candidate division Zixibacteria bacterium]